MEHPRTTPPATIDLIVEGMHCAGCVANVEKALRRVPGVLDAQVNLATRRASVRAAVPPPDVETLCQAVRQAGYDARPAEPPASRTVPPPPRETLTTERAAIVISLLAGGLLIILHFAPRLGLLPLRIGDLTLALPPAVRAASEALLGILLLVTPAGAPILRGAIASLRHGAANMDLLVGLGVTTAVLAGLLSLTPFAGDLAPQLNQFHAAGMILIFINVGRYLEARARSEASRALALLAERVPRHALRITPSGIETVPIDAVRVGDHLRVPQDHLVPVDGIIREGMGAIDESMMTGEAVPAERGPGEPVLGGTRVLSGVITIEATATGDQSAAARILRLVEAAQAAKTPMQRLADRVAAVFVPAVIIAASAVFTAWWLIGGPDALPRALTAAMAVVVIACPCALGLATPAAVMVASASAALRGILVRDAPAFEAASRVNLVAFDKTGTLTTGRLRLERLVGDERTLTWAAAAEQYADHPLAAAILDAARHSHATIETPADFTAHTGLGVEATLSEGTVLVGSERFLRARGVDFGHFRDTADRLARDGLTAVLVALNGRVVGAIGLGDDLRDDAREAVRRLHDMNVRTALLTGDRETAARAIAARAGIDDVAAQLAPDEKSNAVTNWRHAGYCVAMVGDGINDAPALAAADVGIAFASGTQIAAETAALTLVGDRLAAVPDALALARRTVRVIRQNLFWAFAYNLAMIPLAATGWIPPGLAAAAMMVSSLTVVLNALRLRDRTPPTTFAPT